MEYWLEYEDRDCDGYWTIEGRIEEIDTIEEAYELAAEMIHKEKEWKRYKDVKGDKSDFYTAPGRRPFRIIEVASQKDIYESDPVIVSALEKCEEKLKEQEADCKVQKKREREQKKREREQKQRQKAAEERTLYEELKAKYEVSNEG